MTVPSFLTHHKYLWLLLLLGITMGIYCSVKPLALSVDSTYGFLAYKGTLFFKLFNVIPDVPTTDIGKLNHVFMSWWSPGQWLYPGLLNYIFGIRLGVAAIIVTLISMIIGFIGFYRVFIYFNFPVLVSQISLLIIFASSTFYHSFIIYQGGEILEFAIFPWFLLYVINIKRISLSKLLGVAFLFILCFIAKTTLLIYCLLVVMARIIHIQRSGRVFHFRFERKMFVLLFMVIFLTAGVFVIYLIRGPRPAIMQYLNISAEGILVPLNSPFISILSIQEWIERAVKSLSGSVTKSGSMFFRITIYLMFSCFLGWTFRNLIREKKIEESYKSLFFIVYIGLITFFLFSYLFAANIDYSSRHFKLLGYLFIPLLLTFFFESTWKYPARIAIILICFISLADIIYLKEKWSGERYLSVNYFYRNCEPPPYSDQLDKDSYKELLYMDMVFKQKVTPVIFFVESSADIGIDLHDPFIIQRPQENIKEKVYYKKGAGLVVCIAKNTYLRNKGILNYKFPDYKEFTKIAETSKYYFLTSGCSYP